MFAILNASNRLNWSPHKSAERCVLSCQVTYRDRKILSWRTTEFITAHLRNAATTTQSQPIWSRGRKCSRSRQSANTARPSHTYGSCAGEMISLPPYPIAWVRKRKICLSGRVWLHAACRSFQRRYIFENKLLQYYILGIDCQE